METTLDDLFEQQRKTNEATAAAWNQYNTAVNAANNSYDTLMRDLDEQDKAAWDTARSQYQGNQRRAQMMHNAQLLGDLAHLGVQTWSAKPGAMGSAGSNSVFAPIKPTDKYLEQGEAWRQKLNQSYLDEVAARTKRKREDALRGLERGRQAAADQRAWDYKVAQDALAQQEKNYALGRQAQLDEEARQHRDWQERNTEKQQRQSNAIAWANYNRMKEHQDRSDEIARLRAQAALEKGSSFRRGSNNVDTWVDGNGNVWEADYNKLKEGALKTIYENLGGDYERIKYKKESERRAEMREHIASALTLYPELGAVLKAYEVNGAVKNLGATPTPGDVTPPNNQRTGLGWGNGGANSNGKTDW